MGWWCNGKDLTSQCGGEEFKFPWGQKNHMGGLLIEIHGKKGCDFL